MKNIKKAIALFVNFLSVGTLLHAQSNLPKIGSEKGVKEKLSMIIKGLPDIKKNLAQRDKDGGGYHTTFKMGNGTVLFDDQVELGEQSLWIRYSTAYFGGTVVDYQDYYKTLVSLFTELLGADYDLGTREKDKDWTASFKQKGKDSYSSPVCIYIKCNWVLDDPYINIEIHGKPKQR